MRFTARKMNPFVHSCRHWAKSFCNRKIDPAQFDRVGTEGLGEYVGQYAEFLAGGTMLAGQDYGEVRFRINIVINNTRPILGIRSLVCFLLE